MSTLVGVFDGVFDVTALLPVVYILIQGQIEDLRVDLEQSSGQLENNLLKINSIKVGKMLPLLSASMVSP